MVKVLLDHPNVSLVCEGLSWGRRVNTGWKVRVDRGGERRGEREGCRAKRGCADVVVSKGRGV